MNVKSTLIKNTYQSSQSGYKNCLTSNKARNTGFQQQNSSSLSLKNNMLDKVRALSSDSNSSSANKYSSTQSNSILNSMKSYGDALRNQRLNTKNTNTKMKKLKYKFKDISSKIIRSKTSSSAKQVVTQAKREVLRLKREKLTGKYDSEEMDAAITHAKSMERVAKKKAKHLEEEEMAKASGGICAGEEIDDEKALKDEQNEERNLSSPEDALKDYEPVIDEDDVMTDEDYQYEMQIMYSKLNESMDSIESLYSDMEEMTSELYEDLEEGMKDMLSDLGFDELADTTKAIKGEMDPADLKMMKIKHRNKEMKEMVKADAEYLKSVFDNLEKQKSSGSVDSSAYSASSGSNIAIASYTAPVVTESPEPVINIAL